MRIIILILFLGLLTNTAIAQRCDIAQAGVAIYNSSNTNAITTIRIGETANFRFSIRNASTSNSCAIPANTVTAVLDFPTITGGVKPYVYAGPPNFVSGYFSWTYNFAADVLTGSNNREIPAGTNDQDITMRVRGNSAGAGNSNLNITQGKGIADNVANNFSGTRLMVASIGIPVIKLKSFTVTAARCDMLLKWATSTETGSSIFEIEYSADGFSFNKIGTVPGKNIFTGADYEFTYTPSNEKGYYRLKQVTTNEPAAYSDDVFAAVACATKGKITVYPNPVTYNQKLVVNISGFAGKMTGELFDGLGRKIQSYNLTNTINEIAVDKLAAGSYLLHVREEAGNIQTFKIIVTH